MNYKVLLFDVDGVLSIHGESFSKSYAREKEIDYLKFRDFFQGDFQSALVGKSDLKELIDRHKKLWQPEGEIDDLLLRWFQFEESRNEPLLKIIAELREDEIPCYLATNQEYYRGKYMIDTMFKDEFDGYFVSAMIGSKKPESGFFNKVINDIRNRNPGVSAEDILFIDDSPEHVEGARSLGMNAHLYSNLEQIKELIL